MQMSPIGTGGSAFSSGIQPPEKYDLALMAGVRLFTLMYHKRCPDLISRPLMGPFDVKVIENFTPGSNAYKETWLTGASAGIKYEAVDKKGTLIAFMPDDRFYHNRMILADSPQLKLLEMRDQEKGVIPGRQINMEIQCLRDVVNEIVPIYMIMREGREIDYKWTREDAEDFINEETLVPTGKHNYPMMMKVNRNCKIVVGKKARKKSNIIKMIRDHAYDPYGWTACDDFKRVVMAEVNELVRQRSASYEPENISVPGFDIKAHVLDIIKGLSEDEIRLLKGTPSTPSTPDYPGRIDASAPTSPSAGFDLKKFSKTALKRQKIDELRVLAISLGLAPQPEATKASVVEAILLKQEEPSPTSLESIYQVDDSDIVEVSASSVMQPDVETIT